MLPPGPRGPTLVTTYKWLRTPFEFQEDCRERFGDAFSFNLPQLPPISVFANPDVVKSVFADPGEDLHAGEFNRSLEAFLGNKSVLMVDGKSHARKRKLLMPPFHGERMHAYGDVMLDLADDIIDAMPLDQPFAFHKPMNEIALHVIVRNVFGLEQGPREDAVRRSLTELLDLMTWPPFLLPWMRLDAGRFSPWGRALAKRRDADAMLFDEIRRRRADGGAPKGDILSLLLAARDEEGEPMSDDELRDELVTLLVAGHETTATALSWAVRWVLADPEVEARLRDELAGLREPTAERLAALPYLDATAREALRLCPIIPIVGRILTTDATIGGFDLRKGSAVVCSIYLAHRRPEAFPDPTRFHPDRFLERRPMPYEFFPFGGGIRRCIGMAFAMMEMKLVLARLFTRTRMRLEPTRPIAVERRAITLVPSEGLRVRLVERAPRAGRAAA